VNFMENLMIMQNSRNCAHCPYWFECSMIPDECEANSISEDELEKGEFNGTYSESLDW